MRRSNRARASRGGDHFEELLLPRGVTDRVEDVGGGFRPGGRFAHGHGLTATGVPGA